MYSTRTSRTSVKNTAYTCLYTSKDNVRRRYRTLVRLYEYTVLLGCPYLAGSRPKNLGPKTTKGPNSKIFKFNHSLYTALKYFSLLVK